MATYVIGDLQGCFAPLEKLLALIHFDEDNDSLWCTGDLVNRGPQSLEVLRYLKSLGNKHHIILGNHDLHLLAIFYGANSLRKHDTLEPILRAPDCEEIMNWLRHRSLLHFDATLSCVMVHAGICPAWSLEKAIFLAHEVESVLRSDTPESFLKNMYGNKPDYWDDALTGDDRLRCITNFFTRMRFCYADGRLDLNYKGEIPNKPKELIPWFDVRPRANADTKIIFGHWAALGGKTNQPNLYAMDTGCVWGNCLTAMCLEDGRRVSVKCG